MIAARATMIEHVYVHIPFCHRVCPYCAFYKHTPGSTDMAGFAEAVVAEARLQQRRIEVRPRTLFLGGGTPTAMSEVHLRRLISGVREILAPGALEEFAVEANPRTITAAKARMMRDEGVTRVSLGVQAWDAGTLRVLGRDHSAEEAEETFAVLRDAGFPSLNIDLMFSVPGQSMADWSLSLERTLALCPDHISAYNLNYEEDTDFFDRWKRGEYRDDPERDADFFFHALDRLEQAGFRHYEISNYARPGYESAHNAAYWFGKDYLGLGPSAVSTHTGVRWKNLADTRRYVEAVTAGILPQEDAETLTEEQQRLERIALELRTSAGVACTRLTRDGEERAQVLTSEGLLERRGSHLLLTRAGKVLADSIAGELIG